VGAATAAAAITVVPAVAASVQEWKGVGFIWPFCLIYSFVVVFFSFYIGSSRSSFGVKLPSFSSFLIQKPNRLQHV